MRVLVVTAVAAERDAVDVPGARVIAGGIGPAASAAATAQALAADSYDLVVSAGVAGGFAPLGAGDIAVASSIEHADLGGEGFRKIGGAVSSYAVDPQLAVELADRTGGRLGAILTVSTVTGSAARAGALIAQYPDAVAEAMEGAGVAAAAALFGVRCAEVRAISNQVGPYDFAAWRLPEALAALGRALSSLGG